MITAPLVSDTDSLADLEYSLDRLHSEDLGPGVGAGLGPRLHALYRAVNRHPGIVFRNGPAGRRAVVVGGPDVWEVIAAARNAPEHGEELVSALAERIGVPVEKIRIAVRYYAEYPEEIDRFIEMVEQEAKQLERALERESRLLG